MNRALQWKLVAGFILVFVAGIISGMFLGGVYARHLFSEFHRPEIIGARMKERLRDELNLTPDQVAKISPIIDKTAAQLREIRRDTRRRVHGIITESHRQMAANLTDEQRKKLQQMEERHRRWRHGRRGHGRRGHGQRPHKREFTPQPSPSLTPGVQLDRQDDRRLRS
jgi:hypothetical protein